MICEKCKKNTATVYYTENINGKETRLALCHKCAEDMKLGTSLSFDIPGIFGGGVLGSDMGSLIGSILAPQKNTKGVSEQKRCDLCGMSFADLMKEGKAGCPRCYDTFGDELERTVAGIHGGTRHKGKMPAGFEAKRAKSEKLEELRRQIGEAIAAEDYEGAAVIRDRIRAIENGEEETA